LTRENNALEALQAVASTSNEKQKVEVLSELNKNDSLIKAIHNDIQTGAIPILFAVFSRKNDYYGLGGMGA
jgi:hypothetical protein